MTLSEEYQKSSYDVLRGETFTFQENAPVTDFMQTERCVQYLKESYPNIDDWKVVKEFSTYQRQSGNLFGTEDWRLIRYAVLVTEHGGKSCDFDIAIMRYETTYVLKDRAIISAYAAEASCHTAKWEDIGVDSLEGIEVFCPLKYPVASFSMYLPEKEVLLLCCDRGSIVAVKNVKPEERFVTHTLYGMPCPRGYQQMFRASYENSKGFHLVALQSDSRAVDLGSYHYYEVDETDRYVLLFSDRGVTAYDFNRDTPLTPIYTVPAEKITSGSLYFWPDNHSYENITDNKNSSLHAVFYYDYSLKSPTIQLLAFDSAGNILSNFDIGISADTVEGKPLIQGMSSVSDGVATFDYFDPLGYTVTYAVDIREGKSRELQIVKRKLPFGDYTFTDSTSIPDAQIEEMLIMFGAEKDTDGKLYTQERSLYHLGGFSPDSMPEALYLWRCYSYSRFDGLTDSERAEKYRHPDGKSEGLFFPWEEYRELALQYFDGYGLGNVADHVHNGFWMDRDTISELDEFVGGKDLITVDRITEYSGKSISPYKYLRIFLTLTKESGETSSHVLTVHAHSEQDYQFCSYLPASLYQ